jgi:predicted nucleic acid-binding protein
MTPDVNALIAGFWHDHTHHWAARAWFDAADAASETLLLFPMVLASFVRLVIHRKVFTTPAPVAKAFAFVDALSARPGARMLELGSEWPILRDLCVRVDDPGLALRPVPRPHRRAVRVGLTRSPLARQ